MTNENNEDPVVVNLHPHQIPPIIHLYEFECSKCDIIMQIQTGKELTGVIGCICGERMMFSFHSEMQEPVFGESYDIPDTIEDIDQN